MNDTSTIDETSSIDIVISEPVTSNKETSAVSSDEEQEVLKSQLVDVAQSEDFTALLQEQQATNILLSCLIGVVIALGISLLIGFFARGWKG